MQVAVVVGAPLLRIEGLPLRKAAVLRMPQHQMRNPQPLRQLAGILDGGVVLFVGFEALAVLIETKRLAQQPVRAPDIGGAGGVVGLVAQAAQLAPW